MSITPLPTPVPQTSDPANFNTRADALMTALPTFVTEANALQVDVDNQQIAAAASAVAAASSATSSATSATTATTQAAIASAAVASGANSPAWVSGTTYAVGNVVYSPSNFRSYRRITAGAGTTDPSLDTTNWLVASAGAFPTLYVREEQPSNTSYQTIATGAYTTRILNTIVGTNTITGASLSSNQVTLPAGTYEVSAQSPGIGGGGAGLRASLYNVTDSTTTILGSSTNYISVINGKFTITSAKTFVVRVYNASGTASGGAAANDSNVEVYTQAQFWKVS